MTTHPLYITISGLIGAGKSTLASALAKEMNLPLHTESVDAAGYLDDFYKGFDENGVNKYAFPLQVRLLNERFRQQQEIIWSSKGGVQDRSIYEDSIFAKMLRDSGMMEERDYKTYQQLFRNMSHFMNRPTFIVHLDVTPEESLRRIHIRSRNCEKSSITLQYLQDLDAGYQEWLAGICKEIPVIRVDWENFRSVDEVAQVIAHTWDKMHNIRTVQFEGNIFRIKSATKSIHAIPFRKSTSPPLVDAVIDDSDDRDETITPPPTMNVEPTCTTSPSKMPMKEVA